MQPSNEAVYLASQCWTDQETSDIQMDVRLALAFARRVDPLLLKIQWYEASEQVRQVCRQYSELSDGDKKKIDDLMLALKAIKEPTPGQTVCKHSSNDPMFCKECGK